MRASRRGNGGAGGKAVRVVTSSFVKTVADDHRTLYKLPRRRKVKRHIKALFVFVRTNCSDDKQQHTSNVAQATTHNDND